MDDKNLTRGLHKISSKRDKGINEWTLRFEALLKSKDLFSIVESDPIEDTCFADFAPLIKTKIQKTKMLVQSLGDKPLRTITGENSNPFTMYLRLQKRYATQNAARRVQLQTESHQM